MVQDFFHQQYVKAELLPFFGLQLKTCNIGLSFQKLVRFSLVLIVIEKIWRCNREIDIFTGIVNCDVLKARFSTMAAGEEVAIVFLPRCPGTCREPLELVFSAGV